jgi:hypothetical protein
LVEDGLVIVFPHRSFQEYFAARFIAELPSRAQQQLIEKYSNGLRRDNVIRLVHEMRPDVVEKYYIIPRLEEILKNMGVTRQVGMTHYLKFIKACYSSFLVHEHNVNAHLKGLAGERMLDVVRFALNYCNPFGWCPTWDASNKHFLRFLQAGSPETVYDTKDWTTREPLLKALADHGNFFGIERLKLLPRILQHLKTKAIAIDDSLGKLMGG